MTCTDGGRLLILIGALIAALGVLFAGVAVQLARAEARRMLARAELRALAIEERTHARAARLARVADLLVMRARRLAR